jgi:hypothetical protein
MGAQHAGACHLPNAANEKMEHNSLRHRHAAIYSLCQWLERGENNHQILKVTLGLLYFQTLVGPVARRSLDMTWRRHVQAAVSQVHVLKLPQLVLDPQTPTALVARVDILGATMHSTWPAFAHLYREKSLQAQHRLGPPEPMGCEDKVTHLISEVACLELGRYVVCRRSPPGSAAWPPDTYPGECSCRGTDGT